VPELSRAQILVYAALAVAGLLLGARWVNAAEGERADDPAPAQGGTEGSFQVSGPGDLVVHVVGAVKHPGVFRLPAGSRVLDAVERAGGETAEAATGAINLAAQLADGQQVNVPEKVTASAGGATAAVAEDAPISLSSATVEDLDTIEGIGPVTAAQIIEFRDEQGGLSSVDDLDEISGIGPATMEALRAELQP
jgi:competence protein ComEA